MTWAFWEAYTDEAYGIVDDRNDWLENSPVDVEKLDAYLQEITGGDVDGDSDCPIAKAYILAGNTAARVLGRRTRIPPPIRER